MKETHKILFQNPVFHRGTNITVRKGDKWHKKAKWHDLLEIKSPEEDDVIIGATITHIELIKFSDIPKEWLKHEHDPTCRTYEGLLDEMERVYPGFSEDDQVTVIFFEIFPERP